MPPAARKYYNGWDGTVIANNDQCSALVCRIPKTRGQTHISNAFQQLGPTCNVWDIEGNPRAIMNVRATLTYGNKQMSVVIGTEQGNTIAAVDNVLYMQIVRTGFGSGVVASSLPGMIVTCGSCAPGDKTCGNAPFDDLPTADGNSDGFTLYNPWQTSKDTSCSLPLAACRRQFQLGARPSNGFWFYVPPALAPTYAYGVCNSNGFASYQALAGQNSNSRGIVNRICSSIQQSIASCIPGIQQLPGFSLPQSTFTYTPCLVEQLFASRQVCYNNKNCQQTVSFLPLDYNVGPGLSEYFVQNGRIYRNALDTATSQGSVEIALYVSGDFLGVVTSISSGTISPGSVRGSANGN